jgi:hypothetical protein
MLELKKIGVSALYGLVDLGAEIYDQQNLPSALPFQNTRDWERAIAFAGGLVGSYMSSGGFVEEASQALVLSSTPLLEKSVYDLVRQSVTTLPARSYGAGASVGRMQPGTIVLARPGTAGTATVVQKTY